MLKFSRLLWFGRRQVYDKLRSRDLSGPNFSFFVLVKIFAVGLLILGLRTRPKVASVSCLARWIFPLRLALF